MFSLFPIESMNVQACHIFNDVFVVVSQQQYFGVKPVRRIHVVPFQFPATAITTHFLIGNDYCRFSCNNHIPYCIYFHRKVFFLANIMVTLPGYLQSFFHQVKVVFMLGLAGDDELEDEGEAEQRNRYRRCHHFIIYIFWTLFPAPSQL